MKAKMKLPIEIELKYGHLPVLESTSPYPFFIESEHVAAARKCQKDGSKCVIAQACKAAGDIKNAYIGAWVSYLVFEKHIVRFKTPTVLRNALNRWDSTGQWDLTAGVYKLLATASTSHTREREHARRRRASKKRAGLIVDNPKQKINMRRIFENGLRKIAK
jgi:hypothetical protein